MHTDGTALTQVKGILPYVAALILGCVGVLPFVQLDGRFILDSDIRVDDITLYHNVIQSGRWLTLPAPNPNVYFEGHSLIYAFAVYVYDFVRGFFAGPATMRDAAFVTVDLVNAAAHVLASLVFFLSVRQIEVRVGFALLFTALFALSPQILDIEMVRIDRLMMLPLLVLFYGAVRLTEGRATRGLGVAIGVALAFMTATKLTGVLYGAIPVSAALAVVILHWRDRARMKQVGDVAVVAVLAYVPVLLLVMLRFVEHAGKFIAGVRVGYTMEQAWTAVLPMTPRLYYNIDLFSEYGVFFLVLVALSVAVVVLRTVRERSATGLWLLVNLAAFSIAGIFVFKYGRGGYHLVPLYLYALAMATSALKRNLAPRFATWATAACVVAVLIPAAAVAQSYVRSARVALQTADALKRTQLEPLALLKAKFSPGERICIMGNSQWASPPMAGLGFHVTTRMFDFPYLNPAAMGAYIAPRPYQVRAACDALVFNDGHTTAYMGNFHNQGHEANARAWEGLLKELADDYPPTVFAAKTTAFHFSRTEIYDLRHAPANGDPAMGWAGQPGLRDALAGNVVDDGFAFPGGHVAIVPGRLTGNIDIASRLADGEVSLQGWAVDALNKEPAAAVIVVAGTHIAGFDGTATVRRPDVAASLGIPAYQLAGFATCFRGVDVDHVRVFALSSDGVASEIDRDVDVVPTQAQVPAQTYCRSEE